MPVPSFLAGIVWVWVVTLFVSHPFFWSSLYGVGIAISYMIGFLPIVSPIDLWYIFGNFLLVFGTSIAAWVIERSFSIRLGGFGKMFSVNRKSSTYISSKITVISVAIVVFVTLLSVIHFFIGPFGIGWEIFIGAFILCTILLGWFIMYTVLKRMDSRYSEFYKRYIFWTLLIGSVGVLLIYLSLLFRFISWPFVFPDFWVMLIALGVLALMALLVLIIMLLYYYNDKERESLPE